MLSFVYVTCLPCALAAEEDDDRYELESVSDDEADEADLGLDSQHGGSSNSARANNHSNASSSNASSSNTSSRGGDHGNDESFNIRETLADVRAALSSIPLLYLTSYIYAQW